MTARLRAQSPVAAVPHPGQRRLAHAFLARPAVAVERALHAAVPVSCRPSARRGSRRCRAEYRTARGADGPGRGCAGAARPVGDERSGVRRRRTPLEAADRCDGERGSSPGAQRPALELVAAPLVLDHLVAALSQQRHPRRRPRRSPQRGCARRTGCAERRALAGGSPPDLSTRRHAVATSLCQQQEEDVADDEVAAGQRRRGSQASRYGQLEPGPLDPEGGHRLRAGYPVEGPRRRARRPPAPDCANSSPTTS